MSFRSLFPAVTCGILAIAFSCGCSGNVKVKGQVLFEDGTPLSGGEVLFESPGFLGSGRVDKNGNFRITGTSENEGIPPGTYKVSIVRTEIPDGPLVAGSNPVFTPQIDKKYGHPDTSGITCDVKKSMSPLKINVERFQGQVTQRKVNAPAQRPPGAPH